MGEGSGKSARVAAEQVIVALAVAGTAAAAKAAGASDAMATASGTAAVGLSTFAIEWWRAVSTGNDQAVLAMRLPAVEEQFRRLGERIGKIEERLAAEEKDPEPMDPLRAEAVFSEFARAVSEAQTPAKRRALVNAAARQFDPEFGEPAVRGYWLARVRALSDLEIRVLELITEHRKLTFNPGGLVPLNVEPLVLLVLPLENLHAFKSAAFKLAEAKDTLVTQGHDMYTMSGASGSIAGETFSLSVEGKIVARYIAD